MIDKKDMLIQEDDTAKGEVDGPDKKYVRNTGKASNVCELVNNINRRTTQCRGVPHRQDRLVKNISTSLETIQIQTHRPERRYQVHQQLAKVWFRQFPSFLLI